MSPIKGFFNWPFGSRGELRPSKMSKQAERFEQPVLKGYGQATGVIDELITPEGHVRPQWQSFMDGFSAMPPDEQQQRSEKLRRLVHENGLAHDVYSDPDHKAHAWNIDLLPLIIAPDDWKTLEVGVNQRARLLNLIMQDIYGPQNLMKSGKIPARLIYNDSAFLKARVDLETPCPPLFFLAVDVSRNNDGSWRIIDTHTETPAGLGYAIANRVVHTKVLSDLFDATDVRREAAHFKKLMNFLPEHLGINDPRIVVLSHGMQHGDYFSHTYLARYLGYRLVVGSDLQVVGNEIYLKTLSGLKKVDGVIRCIDGEMSDPLTLNPDGFLGPSGFILAIKNNPALSFNTPGAGILENRGLSAYMADLCRDQMGEELLFHDTLRLWMGDTEAREKVIQKPENYLLHPAREGTGRPGEAQTGRRLGKMNRKEQKELFNTLSLEGRKFVAEQPSNFATAPSLTEKGIRPTPYAMRLFAAFNGTDYDLLPGGIAMTVDPEIAVALNSREGFVRDIWVPADGEEEAHQSLIYPHISAVDIDRNSSLLPSRIADNLFWLGRYTERAEWTMRLMRSVMIQAEEERGLTTDVDALRKTLEILITKGGSPIQLPGEDMGADQLDKLIRILRASNVGTFGLKGTIERILRVAQLIRDRLSLEAWQTLNSFSTNPLWWQEVVPLRTDDSVDLLNEGIRTLAAFSGIVTENMTRNYAWRFLEIGRRLERALNHCEVLSSLFAQQADEQNEASRLLFMLKLADSLITYRSRNRFAPDLSLVLDLLIIDESNPRGLCFQLNKIAEHIGALPKSADDAVRTEEQKLILELNTQARLSDIEELTKVNPDGVRENLKQLLEEQITQLPVLSEILSRRYFSLMDNSPVRVHTP